MKHSAWDNFFREKIEKICADKTYIIDIGGGLRIDRSKSNLYDSENAWILERIKGKDFKILDKVPDYNPDIVGDIHDLPLPDASVDAIICMSVIEHVEDPKRAIEECFRVLKPGGYLYLYAPFLFYYHPMPGYYGDFYRFTVDGMRYLTRQFSSFEYAPFRGPIGMLANLFPLFTKRTRIFDWLDTKLRPKSMQNSGYHVFCVK